MSDRLTDIFGIDVFSDAVMLEKLPRKTYTALKDYRKWRCLILMLLK